MRSIGLMSGTSMDGIDASLLETTGSADHIQELGHFSLPYSLEFKILLKAAELAIRQAAEHAIRNHKTNEERILAAAESNFLQDLKVYLLANLNLCEIEIEQQCRDLATYLGAPVTLEAIIQHSTFLHGLAVIQLLHQLGLKPDDIDVVGCHGQAFFHRPSARLSIVLNHGQDLAEQVGIPVVNDFRRNDVKAGGQGAPFAPLYHLALAIRDQAIPCSVINCGGIANVTLIPSNNEADLIGFDMGPGNGLIDRLIKHRSQGRESMDENGGYGLRGQVHEQILETLFEKAIIRDGQNYFALPFPKSLDSGDMTLIPELDTLSIEDACATLEAFTAESIVRSLSLISPQVPLPHQWILAGGGSYNPVIRRELGKRLKERLGCDIKISTADEMGWNTQTLEAQLFAYLAVRSLQNQPLSFPGTTQVPFPLSGGRIFEPTTRSALKKSLGILRESFCNDKHDRRSTS